MVTNPLPDNVRGLSARRNRSKVLYIYPRILQKIKKNIEIRAYASRTVRDEPERGLWKHEGVCEEEEVIDS